MSLETSEGARLRFADVQPGDEVPAVAFPLSVYRLVMAAGSTRDFNSIHHNTEAAQASGAPEMYANTFMLLGMWERAVREYVGMTATIRSISGFRMKKFNIVGDTTYVGGRVLSKTTTKGVGVVHLEISAWNSLGVTVGPGTVVVEVPLSEMETTS
ncbi:hotdog family protein [Nocardioides terrisoli]|uniref:hypothetical protein n=1 Tax=Nocardioides terrisoli TaxID=3388267 RepID=UPI00287B7CD2|nr:hypothetical protein [Nocardioides marmorisolisilvae]